MNIIYFCKKNCNVDAQIMEREREREIQKDYFTLKNNLKPLSLNSEGKRELRDNAEFFSLKETRRLQIKYLIY